MKVKPENIVNAVLSELRYCSIRKDLHSGKSIHSKVVNNGNSSNIYIVNALINMYGKCGHMLEARDLFNSIKRPNLVSWTALLSGYADKGEGHTVLELFYIMKAAGCIPDIVTYVAVFKACMTLAANEDEYGKKPYLKQGREIHSEIGPHLDIQLQNVLINMYGKCGSMVEARQVFDGMEKPNVVSWTSLILGYATNGEGQAALDMFTEMKRRGCTPNTFTYVAVLKACTSLAANGEKNFLEFAKEIHSEIGCRSNHYVQTSLIDMYAKFGSMVDARRVLDGIQNPNVASWNALIMGYVENGAGLAALESFSRMRAAPNSVTYIAALKACTSLAANCDSNAKAVHLERGREIHSQAGCHSDQMLQNALIDMYAKCGSMSESRGVFEGMQKRNTVSWNALLFGYAENGEGHTVLELLSEMQINCSANPVTYIAALKACSLIGALATGRKFHSEITKLHSQMKREFTAPLITSLVDFYAKCGSMADACEVFRLNSKNRGVEAWNALLAGYSRCGESETSFKLFVSMENDINVQPNDVTFLCLLWCCSHAGLLSKAREYLVAMPLHYGVIPKVMHYNCVVDGLGRANQLIEAIELIARMPCNPDVVTWMTLLSACRKWKNVEIGREAFQASLELDRKIASSYILMGHIYGSRGMWEEQERLVESGMKYGAWNSCTRNAESMLQF